MATLYFCVWEGAAAKATGDPVQEGTVTIAGTHNESATITGTGRKVQTVRLFADTNCFVTWGSNPVAVNDGSDGRPMGSENPEYFNIEAGYKISVISRA